MVTLEELKVKVVGVATDIGSYLPYEEDQVVGETWSELADTVRDFASALATSASRMAAYASHATRKRNNE